MRSARALAPAVAIAVIATGVPAARASSSPAQAGAAWIAHHAQSDGGFFAPSYPADAVAEALSALAAGRFGSDAAVRALGYVETHGPARAALRAAYAGRIVLGLLAFGKDPRAFGGTDYVARIASFAQPTGSYDSGVYSDALAVLALGAAHVSVPSQAITYLRAQQCTSGGFGHDEGCTGDADVDTTAIAITALLRAGLARTDTSVANARAWLASARNSDGGFGQTPGAPTNANSTGLALSAIAALHESPAAAPWGTSRLDPVRALRALQAPDGGFRYVTSDASANAYATIQAVPGIALDAYPVPAMTLAGARYVDPAPGPHASAPQRTTAGAAPSFQPLTPRAAPSADAATPASQQRVARRSRGARGAIPIGTIASMIFVAGLASARGVRSRRRPRP